MITTISVGLLAGGIELSQPSTETIGSVVDMQPYEPPGHIKSLILQMLQ